MTRIAGVATVLTILAFLVQFHGKADAATLYVDGSLAGNCTQGNYSVESRSCTGAAGNAFATLAEAEAHSGDGDTVIVRGGVYAIASADNNGLRPKTGQTWRAQPGEIVILDAAKKEHNAIYVAKNGVTIDGFVIRNTKSHGIMVDSASDVTVRNCDVSAWNHDNSSYRHGIRYHRSSGGLVENNRVHDPAHYNYSGGIVMTNGPGTNPGRGGGIVVRNNEIWRVTTGLWCDVDSGNPNLGLRRHVFESNLIYDVTDQCMMTEARSSAVFRYNICRNSARHGFNLRVSSGNNDQVELIGNVFYNNAWFSIRINDDSVNGSVTNLTIKNNIIYTNSGYPQIVVPATATGVPTNEIAYNDLYITHPNNQAICWNQPVKSGSLNCQTGAGATLYHGNMDDMRKFHADTGKGIGMIAVDPRFEIPGKDFRLQCSSPCKGAGEAGVDMGVYPYDQRNRECEP